MDIHYLHIKIYDKVLNGITNKCSKIYIYVVWHIHNGWNSNGVFLHAIEDVSVDATL